MITKNYYENKLILNNIFIHYGATCDSKLNKFLFIEKMNFKKNIHKNYDTIKYFFENKKDLIDKIQIKLIECVHQHIKTN